jgi:hypothetical protein
MKDLDGGDWSIGFNSMAPDSLSHASLMAQLGGRLREVYSDLPVQPIPDQFAVLIERLEEKVRAASGEG